MASGDSLAEWTANSVETDATSPAAWLITNNQPYLDFDAATDQVAYFSGVLPNNYAGGGLTLTLIWTSASATSGNCLWTAAVERQAVSAPVPTPSFATPQTVLAAAPGSAGNLVYSTIAFTNGSQMDSLAVNERFRLQITRDATDGSDTMTGGADLYAVYLRET